MATALKNLTRLGTSPRQIARLLQAKAPAGHMLAYITPEEAEILKRRGGSGELHEDTGIPSFQEVDGFEDAEANLPAQPAGNYTEADVFPDMPITASAGTAGETAQLGSFPTQRAEGQVALTPQQDIDVTRALQAIPTAGTREFMAQPQEEAGLLDKLSKGTGLSKESLARLGLAGGLGAIGASTAKAAAASGQQGKQELQQIATPYQQKGQQLQAAAQRGELTPTGQQSLQALQAQLAQGATARGGVGTAQAAAQAEAFRQQLLQQQYDYGLKLSSLGDNIAIGAIKTGLQADNYVQQLNNSFYTNMAYIASGMSPGTRVAATQTTTGAT